jgi:predicted nucleic acid-binding Zn ribbon protein
MARRKRRIQGIDAVVQRLVGRLDLKTVMLELRARQAWADVVGHSVAQRSVAERLAEKTLYVVVESPAWMNELRYIQDDIISKLSAQIGSGVVKRLRHWWPRPGPCFGKHSIKLEEFGVVGL